MKYPELIKKNILLSDSIKKKNLSKSKCVIMDVQWWLCLCVWVCVCALQMYVSSADFLKNQTVFLMSL